MLAFEVIGFVMLSLFFGAMISGQGSNARQ